MARKKSLRDRLHGHRMLHTEDFLGSRGARSTSSDPYFVYPTTNVKKNKEFFDLEIATPGFAKEDLEIILRNGVLIIMGKKEADMENEGNDFIRKEHEYQSFERSFQLEENTDEDRIEARYEHGMLYIRLYLSNEKKANIAGSRDIPIN